MTAAYFITEPEERWVSVATMMRWYNEEVTEGTVPAGLTEPDEMASALHKFGCIKIGAWQ